MRNFLLFILLISSFCCLSQDLTGFWKGKLTQDTGGYAPEYILEVNITQKNKNLYGETKAYLGKVVVAKLSFRGFIGTDSVYLREYREGIIEEKLPPDYILCIKNLFLSYKIGTGGLETLTGRWDGIAYEKTNDFSGFLFEPSKERVVSCIPGLIYLSKNDAAQIVPREPSQLNTFSETFNSTKMNKFQEIEVSNPIVQVSISDYEEVDGDRVSLYLNRGIVAKNVGVRRNPYNFTIALNSNYIINELSVFAENLGKIPPNTALVIVKDGDIEHKVYISSDFKNSAVILLKYKKP